MKGIHENGFEDVTIYERMDSQRQSYGLTILQGISTLRKLKVFEEIQSNETPLGSHLIFKKSGELIEFFGTIFWPEEENLIYIFKFIRKNLKEFNGMDQWICSVI